MSDASYMLVRIFDVSQQHTSSLVEQGHLYIIDVSQAVDLDHPHALDFLREDCVHVSVSNKGQHGC